MEYHSKWRFGSLMSSVFIILVISCGTVYATGGGNSNNSDTYNNTYNTTNNNSYDPTANASANAISGANANSGVNFESSIKNQNDNFNANTNFNGIDRSGNSSMNHSGNSANFNSIHGGDMTNTNDLSSGSTSNNNLDNVGNASQSQSGTNTQSGHNSQNQSANNQGNSQSTNFTSNTHIPRNNPNVTVFAPNPTSPCMMSFGGGGAGGGFGVMITGTVANENCEINEAARIMNTLNHPEASLAALEIACTGKHAKKSSLCKRIEEQKVAYVESQTPVAAAPAIKVPAPVATNSSDDFGTNVANKESNGSGGGFAGFRFDVTTNQYKWVGFSNSN